MLGGAARDMVGVVMVDEGKIPFPFPDRALADGEVIGEHPRRR